ncbi:AMP-binding protein [Paragemmobacter straminiformis]|uniref:AMP-binding protein n=1 Tax=Paragemmobacter straminiformis TaxID=2045119 RepID=A0A842I3X7_9RHOB|nr:AMP-binding protein [Gemmobacter straminiformis]MBC2834349.1 AMP-binding protein [Gemmobacter straminiformis]
MASVDRFRLHRLATIADGVGRVDTALPDAAVLPETGGAAALLSALARAAKGQSFRIGLEDAPAPVDQTPPVFETLTSGSSGRPRRILRKQASWIASFAVNAGLFGLGPAVRVAVLGRLAHSLSLYGALEGAHMGCAVYLMGGMRPDRQRAALAAEAVEVLYATPSQLRMLVEAGGPELGALRVVLVGGSKLDAALRAALSRLAPTAGVREFYGAAEASFITLADSDTAVDSVGRAYPSVRIAIRNRAGEALKDGAVGEVWVRSPYLFLSYAGDDPGTARWNRGWLSVGEAGWMEKGMLHLAGRVGRMVTVADENVFPEEIETFLAALPGVARVAVLPRRDALRGVVMVAVMQGDPAAETAILQAARARFGPLKAPRAVIWRKDWPMLTSGKTNLTRLAAECGL